MNGGREGACTNSVIKPSSYLALVSDFSLGPVPGELLGEAQFRELPCKAPIPPGFSCQRTVNQERGTLKLVLKHTEGGRAERINISQDPNLASSRPRDESHLLQQGFLSQAVVPHPLTLQSTFDIHPLQSPIMNTVTCKTRDHG